MRHLLYILLSIGTITLFAQRPFLIPFNDNGKWGVIDSNDNIIMPPIYDGIGINYNGDMWLRKRLGRVTEKTGMHVATFDKDIYYLIDSLGKQVLDSPYLSIPRFTDNHAFVRKSFSDWVIVSRKNKEIKTDFSPYYESTFKDGIVCVFQNGKFGFIDTNALEIIPIIYDSYQISLQNRFIVLQKEGKWGILDNKGKGVVYFKYDNIHSYDGIGSYIDVLDLDRGWGFIDTNGVEVILPQYQSISPMSEGMAYFEKEDKIGFMDSLGKVIVPPKYLYAGYFSEGRATIGDDHHQGIIDKNGKVILWTKKYEDIDYFSEGLAAVDDGEKYGFIDLNGKEVIPLKYDSASDFSEGLSKVEQKDKYGFIDKKGKVVIPIIYDEVGSFFKGLSKVKLGKIEFYIDKSGKEYRK